MISKKTRFFAWSFMFTAFAVLVLFIFSIESAEGQSGYSCGGANVTSVSAGGNIASALGNARSGSVIALGNGTYNASSLSTKNNGITLCARNRHGTTITNNTRSETIQIDSDNVTIKGIRFTSNRIDGAGGPVGMIRFASSRGAVIEDNIIENADTSQINIGGSNKTARISNVIVRNNILRNSGLGGKEGEPLYLGSIPADGGPEIVNIQIYGNIIENFNANAVDGKNARNLDIHHNIFKNHQPSDGLHSVGGTILFRGTNNKFYDNIILNAEYAGPWGVFTVAYGGNNKIYNNVVNGSGGNTTSLITNRGSRSAGPTEIYNNTFCNLRSYRVEGGSGLVVRDNIGLPGGAPTSACDAEEQRIRREMGNPPDPGPIVITNPCHQITSPTTARPYGVPYNTINGNTVILSGCDENSANASIILGDSSSNTYIWPAAYQWTGSSWHEGAIQLSCSSRREQWCRGLASADITLAGSGPTWVIAWVCVWDGAGHRCGCTDASCTNQFWRIQMIQP